MIVYAEEIRTTKEMVVAYLIYYFHYLFTEIEADINNPQYF